ncbi:MAG: hypothetical protein ACWA41_02450 [Putridiphycobacter sp.]
MFFSCQPEVEAWQPEEMLIVSHSDTIYHECFSTNNSKRLTLFPDGSFELVDSINQKARLSTGSWHIENGDVFVLEPSDNLFPTEAYPIVIKDDHQFILHYQDNVTERYWKLTKE